VNIELLFISIEWFPFTYAKNI